MKKKLIQLSPFNPPYYPLLNILNKMAAEGYSLLNDNELVDLNRRLSEFISLKDYAISEVRVKTDHTVGESEVMSWLVIYEDIKKTILNNREAIDLSGFPPYSMDFSGLSAEKAVFRFNSFVGLDREITVVFQKIDRPVKLSRKAFDDVQLQALKLLDLLVTDYSSHKELIKRDLLYKSFLLRNLIDNEPFLHYYFIPDEAYPATLFSFKVQKMEPEKFHDQLLKHGIEIGFIKNKNGDRSFIIANFIQHSKEQIEKFVDAVHNILS